MRVRDALGVHTEGAGAGMETVMLGGRESRGGQACE